MKNNAEHRKERVKHFISLVSEGQPMEEVRALFRQEFRNVPADEIALAERQLMEEGMPLAEVQRLCDVHAALFEGAVQGEGDQEPAGHPLFIFSQENLGLRRLIDGQLGPAHAAYTQDTRQAQPLLEALRALQKVDRHYTRKENLFFPYLEQAGVTGPPKVMWGVDDEIRDLIKRCIVAIEAGDAAALRQAYPVMLEKLEAMIVKEEEILKPLLRQHIPAEGFALIARESGQIGYAFVADVEGASASDAKAWEQTGSASPLPRGDAPIQLPSGHFRLEELQNLLNTLPCDITFVGADDTVHFFSEQKERVFPRTRTIIGRRVADCHPPKSLGAVDALVEAFKAGRKDSESFWIQRGGKFVLIRYYAVRDDQGKYLGVLECTEEISSLRALTGEKTLMD